MFGLRSSFDYNALGKTNDPVARGSTTGGVELNGHGRNVECRIEQAPREVSV